MGDHQLGVQFAVMAALMLVTGLALIASAVVSYRGLGASPLRRRAMRRRKDAPKGRDDPVSTLAILGVLVLLTGFTCAYGAAYHLLGWHI